MVVAQGGWRPLGKEPYVLSSYAGSGLHLVCERLRNQADRHKIPPGQKPFCDKGYRAFTKPRKKPCTGF